MMLLENNLYQDDLNYICNSNLPWDKLQDKSVMITGATGMIGSLLVDVLMKKNLTNLNCNIYAMGRSKTKLLERFGNYSNCSTFHIIEHDINHPLPHSISEKFHYIIHLASSTHPVAYATEPISAITTNIIGLYNILEYASIHRPDRIAFASSNEIYGENRGDVEKFNEEYCGYINCNKLRAGYPESKRCGEALCQAYIKERDLDIVIPRLTRSYGPTLQESDTKALSQFIKNALNGQDIVLKSKGDQYYSYTYSADAVAGLLTVLLKGECGEAYNISDEASDIRLRDLAKIVADAVGRKVVFKLPNAIESSGFSTATKSRLDNTKIKSLGFDVKYDIRTGIERTMKMLND